MKKRLFRLFSGALALALAAGLTCPALAVEEDAIPAAVPQGEEVLSRLWARELLLTAARDYNPGVTAEDVMHGDENGELWPDRAVTRAEALVMLERAFGGLPAPVGDNARAALPAETFTDVPPWAREELAGVFAAGIVAGTGEGTFSPDQPVTAGELETFIRRVYALEGTDLKDDFYAAANKQWLDSSTIPPGQSINGALYGLSFTVNDQVAGLITDIAADPQEKGTAGYKIAALYHCVTDMESREKAGAEPIRPYLDAIDAAGTLDELMEADCRIRRELGFSTLLGYGLTADLVDSTRYTVFFSPFSAALSKDFYLGGTQAQTDAYLTYMSTLFTLSGMEESAAQAEALRLYETEKVVAAASLDPQDQADVDKIYNLYAPGELQALFPDVDLDAVYAATRLQETGSVLVMDVGALEAAAAYFTDGHLPELKAVARQGLILSVCGCFGQAFQEASYDFSEAYYGIEGRQTEEQIAAAQVQSLLADYLGRAYAETYFSPQAKADVEEMIGEFIAIYKERILAQDWMSDETKAMAVKKLDAMGVKVGYPDTWETYLDSADIRSPQEGGTFFSNVIAIQKAAEAETLSFQGTTVDKSRWLCPTYTVNAFYDPSANDITFPAAILQAPMYDVNASREENLGAIGYVIAHEITHAFDNNGAKFDEKGNAANWWTDADYAAFQEKCQAVVEWYDGQEAAPGIPCSGALTLSENVADLGAVKCVVEAASRQEDPDYEALFLAMAHAWASTSPRQMREYLSVADVHAPDKLRVNRALQTVPEFYETFGIRPGDGMWVAPEDRVSIW